MNGSWIFLLRFATSASKADIPSLIAPTPLCIVLSAEVRDSSAGACEVTWVEIERSSSSIARLSREIASDRSISSCACSCFLLEVSGLVGEMGEREIPCFLPELVAGGRCRCDPLALFGMEAAAFRGSKEESTAERRDET